MADHARSANWIRPAIQVTDMGGSQWIVERRLSPWRFLFQHRMLGGRRQFQRVDLRWLKGPKRAWDKFQSFRAVDKGIIGWRMIALVPIWVITVPIAVAWLVLKVPIVILAAIALTLLALAELATQAVVGSVLLGLRKARLVRSRIDVIGGYVTGQEVAELRVISVRGFDQATELAEELANALRSSRDASLSGQAIGAVALRRGGSVTTTRKVWLAPDEDGNASGDEALSHLEAID